VKEEANKCKKCKKRMSYFFNSEDYKIKGMCENCADKIREQKEKEELEKDELQRKEKEDKEKKRLESSSPNEKRIEEEIKSLEGGSGAFVVLIILGIIGIFFFIIPGIVFFIWAAVLSSSRKSKAASLRAQLESLQQTKKSSKAHIESRKEDNHLLILKKRFAEGKITESEYLKKKKILEEK